MSERARIPDSVTAPQNRASDPDISVWVSANAGSGKTHVLMLRVIKLLLRGIDPAKILCITFTKAAAANMAKRVFDELAKWTSYDDAQLDDAIRKIGVKAGPAERARARQLFATALETPGGLKVQTIHAFCTRLLHQFPFEADVAAGFSVVDDATEHRMLDELTLKVMLDAAAKPDSPIGRALDAVLSTAADQTFRDVIRDAIGKRDEIEAWVGAAGGVDAAMAQLSQSLGIKPSDTLQSLHDDFWANSHFPEKEWPALAEIFASGSKTDAGHVDRLKKARAAIGPARFDAYLLIFCSTKLEPRKNIVTKAIAEKNPQLLDRLLKEQQRVCDLIEKALAVECRDRTATLVTIAHTVIGLYRGEKSRRGLLDYDDLIDRVLDLFRKTSAAWVLYKLDAGIEHVLIDEAQDTSRKQWDVIGTIIGEFTAGLGAREGVKRTLFTVGDDKQSIFSFQGARPDIFDLKFREYKSAFDAAELPLEKVKLQTSFRSGEIVLRAVDKVFSAKEIYASLTSDAAGISLHQALEDAAPGHVEVWDTTKPEEKPEPLAWDAPFNAESETSPRVELARKIARNVRRWIELDSVGRDGRPVTARDILILVRQRGPLFEAIIRALKDQNVPVAGADRMVLTEHIAIMDLMALADALLLPQDDLALACVLKSPLFGMTEDDLYEIAWNRGGLSLREALLRNQKFAAVSKGIEALSDAAGKESPFTFYARLLGPGGGRKEIYQRLGHEAADALDEFLNLALAYESSETPSLQGFIAWLRASDVEVKRDMEMTRDEVRVMTVHGAKGLEAPIVVLADTTTPPAGRHPPRLLPIPPARAVPDAPAQLIWAGAKDKDVGPMEAAREEARNAAADEYRRLLYVAMTRAAERLIVCGADGVQKRPEGCWYDLVREGLKDDLVEVAADDGDGMVLRYQKSGKAASAKRRAPAEAQPEEPLPGWLSRIVPPEPPRPDILTPSSDEDFAGTVFHGPFERATALTRGRLVHRLLQSLPDIAKEHRADAARLYLDRAGKDLGDELCREIAAQVLALLDDARFAPLFTAGSRAEVPIVGRLPRPHRPDAIVSGQVDRLVVTDDAVLIADYKSNRPAPRDLNALTAQHGHYVRQLALYRAVLARIYPNRSIRAALVWTDIPDLMEVPAHLLDERLSALTPA